MSRPFPSSRGPPYTVGGTMSDKNLEQRINIMFCEKIGKNTSETLAYDEYAMKKLSVFNVIGGSRKGEKMRNMTQEVGSQKREGQMRMWTEYKPWCTQKITCETNSRRTEYE
jgi:hypothetical protein